MYQKTDDRFYYFLLERIINTLAVSWEYRWQYYRLNFRQNKNKNKTQEIFITIGFIFHIIANNAVVYHNTTYRFGVVSIPVCFRCAIGICRRRIMASVAVNKERTSVARPKGWPFIVRQSAIN